MNRVPLVLFAALLTAACNRAEAPMNPPRQTPAATAAGPSAAVGQQLVGQYGCTVCHLIPGVEGGGALGPSLQGLASRPTISNGTVRNTPANLAQFIQNPAALNPETSMPPMEIPSADVDHIVAFLQTLK